MTISYSKNQYGLLTLSSVMTNSYGEEFLYTKSYDGYSPEEARILFIQDSKIDNPYATFSEENA